MTEAIVSNTPNPRIDANPDLVGLPGGRAALTWQAGRADGGFDIMLRLREADGTFGEATRLEAGGEARAPELARLSDDTVLVTWIAEDENGARSAVRAQRFDEQGAELSAPFEVFDGPSRIPFKYAEVLPDPDGGFWMNTARDGGSRDAQDRREATFFAEDASVVPSERVATSRIGLEGDAVLTTLRLGNPVTLDDAALGGFYLPNIYSTFREEDASDQALPRLDRSFALLEDGKVLLTIAEPFDFTNFPASDYAGERREFDPDRSAVAADYATLHGWIVDIPAGPPSDGSSSLFPLTFVPYPEDRSRLLEMQSHDVAPLRDGGFVATWSTGTDVFAQRFDAEGSPVGDNFDVATSDLNERGAAVTQIDGDTMLFAWNENRGGNVEVATREVSLAAMAEGTYEVVERPYLSLQGVLAGEGRAGTAIRVDGGVETNYPLTGYTLTWQRGEPGDRPRWQTLEDETGLRLALDEDDVGSIIRLVASVEGTTGLADEITVEFGDYYGNSGPQAILPALLETARTVTLEGEPNAGETLTARPTLTEPEGPLDGPVFFQWLRDGEPIAGAFDPTYSVTPEDVGADLSVEIRYAETDGTEGVLRSDAVEATALPAVAGGAGDDLLLGSEAAEAISGGAGDDTLLAQGDDRLEGGPGSDVFAFAAGRIVGVTQIEDFAPGDRIALDDALLGPGGADFDPRLADLPTLLAALGTGRLSWSPVDAGRTVWSLGLDPDGDGSDPLAEVARVTAANGDALALEISDVLLF